MGFPEVACKISTIAHLRCKRPCAEATVFAYGSTGAGKTVDLEKRKVCGIDSEDLKPSKFELTTWIGSQPCKRSLMQGFFVWCPTYSHITTNT
eukprot:5926725-Amphidinium_carterae.1